MTKYSQKYLTSFLPVNNFVARQQICVCEGSIEVFTWKVSLRYLFSRRVFCENCIPNFRVRAQGGIMVKKSEVFTVVNKIHRNLWKNCPKIYFPLLSIIKTIGTQLKAYEQQELQGRKNTN